MFRQEKKQRKFNKFLWKERMNKMKQKRKKQQQNYE